MINSAIGLVGVAKQSDRATAASTPSFVHGLTGGQVFKLDRTVESDDVACGVRAGMDSHIESIVPGLDFDTFGYSDVLPLYLLAALGSIVSAAGSATGTYKHTIKLGSSLPYLTFWGNIGGNVTCVSGCKLDQLEMEFEGNSPLQFGITAIGIAATLGLSAIPGSVDPSCFDGYFIPTGGTFKIDTASGTPAVAPVTKGKLSLSNNCTADQLAGSVMPGDVAEGKLTTGGSITVKPDDMTLYRKMVTGSAAGTTPSGVIVYGSFELNFQHSKEANHTLKITATHVPFTADYPEVSPDGGAAEIEFSFSDIGVTSPTGSPITIEVVNATQSYTS